MFRNYLKVTIRNLTRNKLFALISMTGLSIGIACCLLIFMYVQREYSFDSFHANDNLYRVIHSEDESSELSGGTSSNSNPLRDVLVTTFPEVEHASRICGSNEAVLYEDKSFNQLIVYVDPDFFEMFSFNLVEGDKGSVINQNNAVVISEEMAQKYFNDSESIGKMISIYIGGQPYEFIVSGVIENAPENSSIQYDFLISTSNLKYGYPEQYLTSWNLILFSTFIQLRPDTDLTAFCQKLTIHIEKIADYNDEDSGPVVYSLQSITDIHLNPDLEGEMISNSNPLYSTILLIIAFSILLIACINFSILTIGKSYSRSKEVGLRKVLGAQNRHVRRQFFGEAFVLSLLSLFVGILITELLLPTFNRLSDMQLELNLLSNPMMLASMVILTIVTTLLAGFYPAIILSKLVPIDSIKGGYKPGGKNRLTYGLVIVQFVISIILLMGTMVISSQLDFIENAKLGYNKDYVVTFPTNSEGEEAKNILERLRSDLANENSIIDMSGHAFEMGQSWLYINIDENNENTYLIGEDITTAGYTSNLDESSYYFYTNFVDEHYITTMGIKLLEGRNFSSEHASDNREALIINRTAARMMCLENPIGSKLPRGFESASIIGVVEDFHFYPLHRKIEPLVLRMNGRGSMTSIRNIAVHISSNETTLALEKLKNSWNKVTNGLPFNYQFIDERVGEQYANEMRWEKVVNYSSIVSIIITCLGLFGLTSLAVLKRTKEIAIRKVLGASTPNIIGTLTREFLVLVLIANLIAWPVAFLTMNHWLSSFNFHIGIGFQLFVMAGLISLFVALATMSYHALRASSANPIDSIKND